MRDGSPSVSGQVDIDGEQDGLPRKRNRGVLIGELGEARKVLGGIEREGLCVGIGVIPTRVGGAVPRIGGARGAGADGRGDERCEGK